MELKGKPLSLGAKVLGAAMAVGSLLMKATVAPDLDMDAALKAAGFVALLFAPVDLSMALGNVFGWRGGGK
jgi:predicted phage tail protein